MRRLSWSCQSSCHKEWFKRMITATHVQTILLTVIYFNYRDVESGHPPIDLKNALLWYVPEGIFTSIARDLHTLQSCSFRRQTSVWSRLPKIIHDCLSTGNGGLYIDWQYGILSSRTCSRYPQPLSCHYWCSERWKASFLYRWVMIMRKGSNLYMQHHIPIMETISLNVRVSSAMNGSNEWVYGEWAMLCTRHWFQAISSLNHQNVICGHWQLLIMKIAQITLMRTI